MTSMSIDGESLRQLVVDARGGDPAAAERLVRQHQGWVRSAVYAATGRADLLDDIAQQVWARAWEQLDRLENPCRLRPWLYAIARNTAIDMSAAQRRRDGLTASLGDGVVPADRRRDNPAKAAAGNELRETLLWAVQALPAIYREPFVLRHLQDWSYAEIGDVLGLSVETVETRLVRARRLMREMLVGKVEL